MKIETKKSSLLTVNEFIENETIFSLLLICIENHFEITQINLINVWHLIHSKENNFNYSIYREKETSIGLTVADLEIDAVNHPIRLDRSDIVRSRNRCGITQQILHQIDPIPLPVPCDADIDD